MNKEPVILYLAKYAPNLDGTSVVYNKQHSTYAQYHGHIYEVLKTHFNTVIPSNDSSDILNPPSDVNYIFSLYNRMPFRNSEVFISSVAEYHGLSYLGATPNIRALAEDKYLTKMLANFLNVPTPKGAVYSRSNETLIQPSFPGPYFVKPRFGAASLHISEDCICDSWYAAKSKVLSLLQIIEDVMVEQFIDGIYYTSPVISNFNQEIYLPCIEEISELAGNVVTYGQKRKFENGLKRTVVSDLSLNEIITSYSRKLYRHIQPLDYTRFDYIIDKHTGIPYLLEFNVCCNLGEHSTIAQSAASIDINYEMLILNITHSSLSRSNFSSDSLRYKL